MDSRRRLERDPSRHPLSDPHDNDPTAMAIGEDTIRVLRGEYIYYADDTLRGLPCSGISIDDFLSFLLIWVPYTFILGLFKPASKVSVHRVRRDWTGKVARLHREVLARGVDPEPLKAELAGRIRAGEFD